MGAVTYLNTKPLVYRLAEHAPQIELVYDLPSRLAEGLARAAYDVALIPSIECFQNPDYTVVSDACIACRGPVMSVRLLSRVPLQEIRTLALDVGSRTSAALVRILLRQQFDIAPRLTPLPLGVEAVECPADAVLVIGDRAMHTPSEPFPVSWDLGEAWCQWAELPMVFAMWVARPGVELGELPAALTASRDEGLRNLAGIAAEEGPPVGLSVERAHEYLRENLHFVLGPREQAGLLMYHRHAAALELAPAGWELRFDDCQAAR